MHRRYIDVGCDVICTNTWGLPTALRDGGSKLGELARNRSTGWTSRAAPCASPATPRRTPAGSTRSRSRSASTVTSTRPTAARRSGCSSRAFERASAPDLILLETLIAGPQLDIRDGRGPARHRAAGVAELPSLSPRACAASTASTGAAPRATRSAAPRGASRRWASARWRSTASRPITCPGCSRGFATSPICRSASTPTSATCRSPAGARSPASPGTSTPSSRSGGASEGAQIIGGCCGVRTRASGRRARSALSDTKPGHARPAVRSQDDRGSRLADTPARPWQDGRGRGLYPLDVPGDRRSSPACSSRRRAASWRGSTSTGRGSAPTSGASTSVAGRVC